MRSITNFLLFETIFDNLPLNNQSIVNFANKIFSPNLDIVAEDCGTKLGTLVNTGSSAVGRVSLLSYGTFTFETGVGLVEVTVEADDILTTDMVTGLLSANVNPVATRNITSCTAPGGLCRKCIRGSNPDEYPLVDDVPAVGQKFKVVSDTNRGFLSYLTDTHTGGLLGFQSLETENQALLPVREELIRSKISPAELSQVFRLVSKIESADDKFLDYARDMKDPLEKALFLILMYGFFTNVRT